MVWQCRQCGRRDRPSRTPALELCDTCEEAIAAEVQARVSSIHEALGVLAKGGDLPTRRAQYNRILAEAEALHDYEVRGILTTCPPPSTLLADFRVKREAIEREPPEGREKPSPSGAGDPSV